MMNKTIFDQTDCTLNPGETIHHSGVYEICHEDETRATVMLIRNTVFPYCKQCGENVRYKLLQRIPHISEDKDFSEPQGDIPGGDNPGYLMQTPISTVPIQLGQAHGFRFQQDNLQAWRTRPEGRDL
jgi:hypothetical protein